MNNNKDTMARLPAGMRAYAYRFDDQARVALHLPHGTEAIDLSAEEMYRFAERLGELADESPREVNHKKEEQQCNLMN